MHWLSWEPLCEPNFYVFLCVSVLRVASGPRVKLVSCKSALNPLVICSTDRSKAVVPVLVLFFVALWFILRGDLLCVFPSVLLFLCFSVLLVLRLPRLGKRELILVLFMHLFGLCLFGFVGFLFLLGSGKGCGLWLWHFLDFSLTFFVTGNYCYETGSMTGVLEELKWESLKKRRRDNRLTLKYKGLKGAASIPTDDLIPQLGAAEIITPLLQELTFTRAHSSLKQSEIGMPFQTQLLPLLKVQRMVWLGSSLWWELGTNFPYYRSLLLNVIRHKKNSDCDLDFFVILITPVLVFARYRSYGIHCWRVNHISEDCLVLIWILWIVIQCI